MSIARSSALRATDTCECVRPKRPPHSYGADELGQTPPAHHAHPQCLQLAHVPTVGTQSEYSRGRASSRVTRRVRARRQRGGSCQRSATRGKYPWARALLPKERNLPQSQRPQATQQRPPSVCCQHRSDDRGCAAAARRPRQRCCAAPRSGSSSVVTHAAVSRARGMAPFHAPIAMIRSMPKRRVAREARKLKNRDPAPCGIDSA